MTSPALPKPQRVQVRVPASTWRLAKAAAAKCGKTLGLFVAEAIVAKIKSDCPEVLTQQPRPAKRRPSHTRE